MSELWGPYSSQVWGDDNHVRVLRKQCHARKLWLGEYSEADDAPVENPDGLKARWFFPGELRQRTIVYPSTVTAEPHQDTHQPDPGGRQRPEQVPHRRSAQRTTQSHHRPRNTRPGRGKDPPV